MPEAELVTLPGFSHDIAASRVEARRLLAEAGVPNLAVTLTNRKDVPVPYGPAGDYVVAAWRDIGVQATQELLSTKDWQTALETGRFAAATDLAADYFDDPTDTACEIRFPRPLADQPFRLDRPLSRRALYRSGDQY
jgi:peptide/nickel transport system substrate-binding protein